MVGDFFVPLEVLSLVVSGLGFLGASLKNGYLLQIERF